MGSKTMARGESRPQNTTAAERGSSRDPARWRGGFSPLPAMRLALLRLRNSLRLLLAVAVGMLVAVVLICTVPLYTTLVSNVQVRHVLTTAASSDINIEAEVTSYEVQGDSGAGASQTVRTIAQRDVGDIASYGWSYTQTDNFVLPLQINGQKPQIADPQLPCSAEFLPYAFDYTAALPHMRILSGKLPQDTAPGQMPQVMVTPPSYLKVGDTLRVSYNNLLVKVVGVWFPKDLHDPFWNGASFDTLTLPGVPCPSGPPTYPLLFTTNTFMSAFATPPNSFQYQPMGMVQHFVYFTKLDAINASTMGGIADQVKTFRADLNGELPGTGNVRGVAFGTKLDTLVGQLTQQLGLLNLPLYIIVAQVAGLALLFVIAMAGLLVDGQAGALATLKSRGASSTQLLSNYTFQGLLLAALAAIAGPFIAVAVSLLLIRLFLPALASSSADARVIASTVSPGMVARPAVVAAALGAAALAFAAWQAARLDVLAFRRELARGGKPPLWRRYHLDLLLVVLCIAGYLELGQFGGLNIREQLGATAPTGPDPLLLITPGLLLLAGALLVLRLFPLGAGLGAWLAARGRGATGLLAFAQVSRGAGRFSRLTLLLTLSVGLGIFALTFQASLGRNASDRAAYITGGDERVQIEGASAGTQLTAPFQAVFAKMPGVEGITPLYRSTVSSSASGQASQDADLLGIDPTSFAGVGYWRTDFASQPLSTLMAGMREHEQGAQAGDQQHPLWTLVSASFASAMHLRPGDRFQMTPQESLNGNPYCIVGAVVSYFPTIFNDAAAGFVVVDERDYLTMLANPNIGNNQVNGPTEFWLRTNGNAADNAARAQRLADPDYFVAATTDRRQLTTELMADPLTAGMTGLLVLGAVVAALLAVLGSLIQSGVAARQRLTQFAILRTLGTSGGQLTRLLLGQQLIVYAFGLLGGAVLGLILSTATLPFLQFSSALVDPTTLGVPPYVLVFDVPGLLLFGAVVAAAFAVALMLAASIALRVGLGKALRLGED